jgi:hypothetical protein
MLLNLVPFIPLIGQAGMAANKAIRNPYQINKRGKLGRKTHFAWKNDTGCQFFNQKDMPIFHSPIKNYVKVPFQTIFAPEIVLYDDQQKKYQGKSDANPLYG